MSIRIIRKGGIWKNSEDEVLKAAVMKYGKNQWARIASLLSKKTAKQCKSRWYEWLDPSIKKVEWSREEEEKLLHMSKIMPMQWRTIAPIVGRTAAQCLEHYEKLLDSATGRDDYDPAEDPRRLRPGEIDPNPERKPAIPDRVDMEEDEKEMLQEARARLANTKGKKAKRKAREKQLEEARRLAALQKRRELKAAGITTQKPHQRKKRGIDYNKEIPFPHRPAPGFHSVAEEDNKEREAKRNPKFRSMLLQELEGERRDEIEEKKRKQDAKKAKEKAKDPNAIIAASQKETQIRRSVLNMPAALLSDQDINQLAKIDDDDADEEGVTSDLLANYAVEQTPAGAPVGPVTPGGFLTPAGGMTPGGRMLEQRTPLQNRHSNLMAEAQNLKNLTEASTPLIGGENVELHPSDFSGATPKRTPISTPHSLRQEDPLTARSERAMNNKAAKSISEGLSALPAPKEFKPTMPEDMEVEEQAVPSASKGTAAFIPDTYDLQQQGKTQAQFELEAKNVLRSQTLKRQLPRPTRVNATFSKTEKEIETMNRESDQALEEVAAELVKLEIVNMITHDAITEPTKQVKAPAKVDPAIFLEHYDQFTAKELQEAKSLLDAEALFLEQAFGSCDINTFADVWEDCFDDLIYIPHLKKFSLSSRIKSEEAKAKSVAYEYDVIVEEMKRTNKKVQNLEKKANAYLTGYSRVAASKEKEIDSLFQQIDVASTELNCFKMMAEIEQDAIPYRLEDLRHQSETQRNLENLLQEKYANLVAKKAELIGQKTSAA